MGGAMPDRGFEDAHHRARRVDIRDEGEGHEEADTRTGGPDGGPRQLQDPHDGGRRVVREVVGRQEGLEKIMEVEILNQKGYDFLWIDGELWMWSIPEEQLAQKSLSDQSFGDVLVAGYGLGLLQEYLMENVNVKSVISIEVCPEVIIECNKHYGRTYGTIILDNFNKFYMPHLKFDCIIGDIWKDIIPECLNDYKIFKTVARQHLKDNGKILAWGQELFEYLIEEEKKNE